MRKININNPEELKSFRLETTGFVSSYGFPYRLDDLTDKGANYTVFCPFRWKSAFPPVKLRKLLREDVDADVIKVEYIDFVKEEIKDKNSKVWIKGETTMATIYIDYHYMEFLMKLGVKQITIKLYD